LNKVNELEQRPNVGIMNREEKEEVQAKGIENIFNKYKKFSQTLRKR
jgi:hypothetical protein